MHLYLKLLHANFQLYCFVKNEREKTQRNLSLLLFVSGRIYNRKENDDKKEKSKRESWGGYYVAVYFSVKQFHAFSKL